MSSLADRLAAARSDGGTTPNGKHAAPGRPRPHR